MSMGRAFASAWAAAKRAAARAESAYTFRAEAEELLDDPAPPDARLSRMHALVFRTRIEMLGIHEELNLFRGQSLCEDQLVAARVACDNAFRDVSDMYWRLYDDIGKARGGELCAPR